VAVAIMSSIVPTRQGYGVLSFEGGGDELLEVLPPSGGHRVGPVAPFVMRRRCRPLVCVL
jgi:hypothetical protein